MVATFESDETLATLERLVVRDAVSVHAAIQAAYRLGVVDGQLKMAAVTQKGLEETLGAFE